jgi:hypothetical protein
MSDATSRTQLRSDFDNFLWSPIGNDAKGMPVSVLSALARAKPDPWKEAAELARLPRDSAVQRLAQCIGTTQGVVPGEADSKTIATKLIAQLPRQQIFETAVSDKILSQRFAGHPRLTPVNIVLGVLILAVIVEFAVKHFS